MKYQNKSKNPIGRKPTTIIGNKFFKKIVLTIPALFGVGAVLYTLWLQGAFLPRWIVWEQKTFLDQSGTYEIELNRKSIRVLCSDAVLWTSPDTIKVQDALCCDIDNDNLDELILLCWKIGRFGRHKPFWVEKDEQNWSQHIFVYEMQENTIRPKWMSSYIGFQARSMRTNGKAAPASRLWLTDLDGTISSWFWDSWGFTKEKTDVSFVVFGDNLIHEPIYCYGLQQDPAFGFLFENMQEVITKSDIAVLNQETPLTDNPIQYSDYPRFGTPVNVGHAIVDAGFDIVTCATNHILDKGSSGVDFTKNFFSSNKIKCIGIQTTAETEYCPYEIITRNGIRFALLNYTYDTNGIKLPENAPYIVHLLNNETQIRSDIAQAKADADFVIVFAHWGTENTQQIDDFQRKWTQVFLDCKVDVVIGTHPHTLQPYEMLEGNNGCQMLVYYSIGNYISAQSEPSCVKGGMAAFTVSLTDTGYAITDYSLQPLTITWHKGGKYSTSLQ